MIRYSSVIFLSGCCCCWKLHDTGTRKTANESLGQKAVVFPIFYYLWFSFLNVPVNPKSTHSKINVLWLSNKVNQPHLNTASCSRSAYIDDFWIQRVTVEDRVEFSYGGHVSGTDPKSFTSHGLSNYFLIKTKNLMLTVFGHHAGKCVFCCLAD